jgi:hypothetical protein
VRQFSVTELAQSWLGVHLGEFFPFIAPACPSTGYIVFSHWKNTIKANIKLPIAS